MQGVVITGVSLGLPNGNHPERPMFDPQNFGSIFRGENFIGVLSSQERQQMLGMNVVQVSRLLWMGFRTLRNYFP